MPLPTPTSKKQPLKDIFSKWIMRSPNLTGLQDNFQQKVTDNFVMFHNWR